MMPIRRNHFKYARMWYQRWWSWWRANKKLVDITMDIEQTVSIVYWFLNSIVTCKVEARDGVMGPLRNLFLKFIVEFFAFINFLSFCWCQPWVVTCYCNKCIYLKENLNIIFSYYCSLVFFVKKERCYFINYLHHHIFLWVRF